VQHGGRHGLQSYWSMPMTVDLLLTLIRSVV